MDDPTTIDLRESLANTVCRWQSLAPSILTDEEFDEFHSNGTRLMEILQTVKKSKIDGPWTDELWRRMERGWEIVINRWAARSYGMTS